MSNAAVPRMEKKLTMHLLRNRQITRIIKRRPIQYLAEDNEPEYDSDLTAAFDLSNDGRYVAGLAYDFDGDNGGEWGKPRLSLHVWEIPPGIIIDVKSMITVTCRGDSGGAGEIIEEITGSDEAQMERQNQGTAGR